MLPLLLNLVYAALVVMVFPVVIWKRWKTGKYRHGWRQKLLGHLPDLRGNRQPRIWLHAVSVGEVLQLRQIVERLAQSRPGLQIVITTTTETGYAIAKEKFPNCVVGFFPLDFTWAVKNALRRIRPCAVVLVELELWPNFILSAQKMGIPLALINARLSQRSFRGYSRIRRVVRRLMQCFSLIAVQTEEYRDRFVALGAREATTIVTGSIKFDGVQTNANSPLTSELKDWLQIGDKDQVIVAGSTQSPEEEYALDAYAALRSTFPFLRLIIVPRHPERGSELVDMIVRRGFPVQQRSSSQRHGSSNTLPVVGLLDTVGELGACWALADVAFVGGSFGSRGGQNMLEPAAFGKPVCVGPNTSNFKQIVELLHAHSALKTVSSAEEMRQFFEAMLTSEESARSQGERAKQLVLSQQGATDKTVALLLEHLDGIGEFQTPAAA